MKAVSRDFKTPPQTVIDPGRVSYTGVSLRTLLITAYGVSGYRISGPNWVALNAYDVAAKLPASATAAQIPAMLQKLLTERFQMTLHRETRDLPVYALIVNKGGPKLKPAVEGQRDLRTGMDAQGLQANGKATMAKLAEALSPLTDRPILDLTAFRRQAGRHPGCRGEGTQDW